MSFCISLGDFSVCYDFIIVRVTLLEENTWSHARNHSTRQQLATLIFPSPPQSFPTFGSKSFLSFPLKIPLTVCKRILLERGYIRRGKPRVGWESDKNEGGPIFTQFPNLSDPSNKNIIYFFFLIRRWCCCHELRGWQIWLPSPFVPFGTSSLAGFFKSGYSLKGLLKYK